MAKLEIPSIVVQSGSNHTPPVMDRAAARTQWSLSTQSTYEDDADPVVQPSNGETDHTPPSGGEKESESKTEPKHANNNNLPRTRSKANLKLLKRSHAIKESTSPPPDIPLSPVATSPTSELPTPPSSNNNNNSSTMNNNGLNPRPTIKREGSNHSSDSNWSSSLSRGNSMEQQNNEQAPLNIEQFLAETINGHAKDRIFLLRIENELISFIKDTRKTTHKFGMMSSYQRMLVHRVAHYYGMDHNVDASGHMVVVSKGKSTKMPVNRLNYFIRDDLLLSEEPRKSILKRDSASFEDTVSFKSPDRHNVDPPRRSKSFEEREEEYEKARARIFHQEHGDHAHDNCSHDCEEELGWPQLPPSWERTESSDSTKLHPNSHRPSRLTKVESYESRDTLRANSLRSSVSKSYSFGGYDQSSNNRVLTKQDSGSSVSSRVSPSSSGYKSQSQRSDTTMSATPSPSATPHLTTQLSNQSGAFSPDIEQDTVLWAVTNMASVPAGSVLINPQTGQPVKNEDGSVYHYDPENPPKLNTNAESTTTSQQTCENGRKSESGSSESSAISRRSLNESSGSSEPPATISASTISASTPGPPPASSYHHEEGASLGGIMTVLENHISHLCSLVPTSFRTSRNISLIPAAFPVALWMRHHQEPDSNGGTMASLTPYHHMPPPAPAALQHVPANTSTYTAAMMYNPPSAPYNGGMQPPAVEGYAATPTNAQHIVYGVPFVPTVQGPNPFDRGTNTMDGQDLCSYLMGLSFGDANRPEPQRVYFCPPPSPLSQPGSGASGPAVSAYFIPQHPAPPPQPVSHQPRYPQCAYQYPQPPDRSAPDCNYPQPGVHAYFSRCPSTPQVGGTAASYCTPSGGSTGGAVTMGVAMLPPAHTQTARPYHRLPTPPNTPQNGCAQYPIYNNGYTAMPGCYQHYQAANPPSQIPLTPMMRPALQLNVGNSPPMRTIRAPSYNTAPARSPVLRDPAPSEPPRHSSSPLRYSAAVTPSASAPHYLYRFSFPGQYANEYFLMNNNRAPFSSPPVANRLPPSVPFPNLRRSSRPRAVGPGPAPSNCRPVFAASQQQAALATAIESAGHNDPRLNGMASSTFSRVIGDHRRQ